MTAYKIQSADSNKDKDVVEIVIGGAALGALLGAFAGFTLAAVMGAIVGGLLGGGIGAFISHWVIQKVHHGAREIKFDHHQE